jgi:hypothetical protein
VHTKNGDAIQVELEHADGHAMVLTLPTARKRFGGGIEYGEFAAMHAARLVADRMLTFH